MYEVQIHRDAEKALRKLPREVQVQIAAIIRDLKTDAYCHNAEKLTDRGNTYRIRLGSYCVIYELDTRVLSILITKIAPRSERTYPRRKK